MQPVKKEPIQNTKEALRLASIAYSKLEKVTYKTEVDLLKLICHANLLDDLIETIESAKIPPEQDTEFSEFEDHVSEHTVDVYEAQPLTSLEEDYLNRTDSSIYENDTGYQKLDTLEEKKYGCDSDEDSEDEDNKREEYKEVFTEYYSDESDFSDAEEEETEQPNYKTISSTSLYNLDSYELVSSSSTDTVTETKLRKVNRGVKQATSTSTF